MRTSKGIALQVLPFVVVMMADSCIDSRSAAYAARGREPPSLKVSIRDLDLTTDAGAAAAYVRIRNAARSVCGLTDTIFMEERAAWAGCVDGAIGGAVARLGTAKLTDYYLARTHRLHPLTTAGISRAVEARGSRR